jgi:uncharacterized membrane protein
MTTPTDRPQTKAHGPARLAHAPFGSDRFGLLAERFARLFGTPGFLIVQTLAVAAWIGINALVLSLRWDPYPFILLNLVFSTQAAYAAPLILLAQTRQADRDRAQSEFDEGHAAAVAEHFNQLLEENLKLTRHVAELTERLERLERR